MKFDILSYGLDHSIENYFKSMQSEIWKSLTLSRDVIMTFKSRGQDETFLDRAMDHWWRTIDGEEESLIIPWEMIKREK